MPLFPRQDINLLRTYSKTPNLTELENDAYAYASRLFCNPTRANDKSQIEKVGQIIGLKRVSPCFTELDKCMFAKEAISASKWDDPFVKLACYVALHFGRHRDDLIASVLDATLVNWDKRKIASVAAMVDRRNSPLRFTACLVQCLHLLCGK